MPAHALRTAVPSVQHLPVHDGMLHLAKNFKKPPDLLIGDGNSILGTGMPGSGKTTVMALLLEQFGACDIPFSAFDLEGDLGSVVDLLPRGVRATPDNCPTAEDMYKGGLQVVFDLASWGDDSNRAAQLIIRTVNGLLTHMKALPVHLRVPFLVGLDEAAYWLPQNRKSAHHLRPEQLEALFATFHTLAIRGRKMGLIPMLFTQRFADVHKDVIAPGTYILMRQTTDTDLKRYMEYVDASAFGEDEDDLTRIQMRQRIAAFPKGRAIVKTPDSKQGIVQFYNRASLHTSHAPKAMAAQNLYRDVPFDKSRRYGADDALPSSCGDYVAEPPTSKVRVLPAQSRGERKEQIFALLEADPTLTAPDLVNGADCPLSTAERYHAEYFRLYPDRRVSLPTLKEQVYALLEADPTLLPMDTARHSGGVLSTVQRYHVEYFQCYPERRVELPTLKEQIFALLEADPTLTPASTATQTGGNLRTIQKWHAEYFHMHPERRPVRPMGKGERAIRAALAENPNATVSQIYMQTRCSHDEIRRILTRINEEKQP